MTGPPLRGGIYKSQIVFEFPPSHREKNGSSELINSKQVQVSSDNLVKVYPTPARDVITLSIPDALVTANTIVSILSIDGKVMQSGKSAGSKSIQLDLSKLPTGHYLLRITNSTHMSNKAIIICKVE